MTRTKVDLLVDATLPLNFTVTDLLTLSELAVTRTDVCPAGTVTLAGSFRATFPDVNNTAVPPTGAAPVIVTVTPTTSPLTIVARLTVIVLITGGFTLTLVDFLIAPT
jgi:hypothetical protein